ncbi:lipopolysaccharide kinase InaA family protein [Flavobacterium sp. JP2137]|uniref:lipopolysaccharide kinase InaA family protein n=1 Tax=Flavobacterium sp. JP2137 TaxID=3414510 RepID=UPI003D2FAE46
MKTNTQIQTTYSKYRHILSEWITHFKTMGQTTYQNNRNIIKVFRFKGYDINIKSFKIPNTFNKIVYKYFRKSKAQRSYEHAKILLSKGINTPTPIAYHEAFSSLGLKQSYYVSLQLPASFTFREVDMAPNSPERNHVLRQFTRFTWKLHELGIEFLDHSPGNTLIRKKSEGQYDFYIVDLNRMKFRKHLSFDERMKNMSRLTTSTEVSCIMSQEYAKLYDKSPQEVFEKLWQHTVQFQKKGDFKKKLKKHLGLEKQPATPLA